MKPTIEQHEIPDIREWGGSQLSPVEEVLMFHHDQGPVPQTYRHLEEALQSHGMDHVVIGALAMAAYGYKRAASDVDICVREHDVERFLQTLVGGRYQRVEGRRRRFYDPQTQVTFDLLVSGRLAGRPDKNKEIRFPDPSEAIVVGGLSTVSLERLIALKLVTWRFKDWADVVELIRTNRLDDKFAASLPGVVRSAYLQCYDQMLEENRYERQMEE